MGIPQTREKKRGRMNCGEEEEVEGDMVGEKGCAVRNRTMAFGNPKGVKKLLYSEKRERQELPLLSIM